MPIYFILEFWRQRILINFLLGNPGKVNTVCPMSMGKTVFITGVSSGLGFGLAKHYLNEGARVFGCSRRKIPELEDAHGRQFQHLAIDLADFDNARDKMAGFIPTDESLDLVILNAGILGKINDMSDTSIEELKHIMDVNLWSNKWLLDFLLGLDSPPRQIVAISSGASVSGSRGWNGYSISKAALNMMIKLYAQEAPHCHLTSFAPGLIDSAMQDYLTNLPEDERFTTIERLKQAKGTENMPNPETAAQNIANVLPRLLSFDSGAYVDIRKL